MKKRILRAAALLLSSLLLLSGCGYKRTTKEIESTAFGIDVSKYQGNIDWDKVAAAGVDFAMIRVGNRTIVDGELKEDSSARYNLQEASRAGIPIGVYFFSTAISEKEAQEEAQWVLDLIAKYPITYPVVYDCEGFSDPESRQNHLSNAKRTDIALAFMEAIEAEGYEAMFYSSRNELHQEAKWEVSRIDEEYKIWVAQYPAEPYPATPASSYEDVHHMWQFTMEGAVPGIETDVDINVAYFAYDGIEPPHDKEPPEEAYPDPEALMNFQEVDEEVTAKEATSLRDIPSQDTDSLVLLTLQSGQIARRIAVSHTGWSKLEFEGNIYYAVSSYLTTNLTGEPEYEDPDGIQTQFTPTNQVVTAKDMVNLRALPSVEHEDAVVIAQLHNGQVATCVGTSDNGWSKLVYNGTTCYAVSSYLTTELTASSASQEYSDDMEIETVFEPLSDQVTAKVEVNLRLLPSVEDPRAVVMATIKNGDIVTRTGINRDVGWSRVNYNGQTLYCVSSYLKVVG